MVQNRKVRRSRGHCWDHIERTARSASSLPAGGGGETTRSVGSEYRAAINWRDHDIVSCHEACTVVVANSSILIGSPKSAPIALAESSEGRLKCLRRTWASRSIGKSANSIKSVCVHT